MWEEVEGFLELMHEMEADMVKVSLNGRLSLGGLLHIMPHVYVHQAPEYL
jgi:hypothetical protein